MKEKFKVKKKLESQKRYWKCKGKGCGSKPKKVGEIKIIVGRSKYYARKVTPQSHRTSASVLFPNFFNIQLPTLFFCFLLFLLLPTFLFTCNFFYLIFYFQFFNFDNFISFYFRLFVLFYFKSRKQLVPIAFFTHNFVYFQLFLTSFFTFNSFFNFTFFLLSAFYFNSNFCFLVSKYRWKYSTSITELYQ